MNWETIWAELRTPFVDASWWEILNSAFVTTFISAGVGLLVAQRVNKVAQTNQAEQDAERAKSDAEDALAIAPPTTESQTSTSEKSGFKSASQSIAILKEYVRTRGKRVNDGRTRRKYANLPLNDYRIITQAIFDDGGLEPSQHAELLSAYDRWRPYRTGMMDVPPSIVADFAALAKRYKVTDSNPTHWSPRK